MGGVYKSGFTIIETMLFLGISGLLVVALLAGVGTSVAVQRYHDSVTSLENLIQNQYSQANNVINDRPATASCGTDANVVNISTTPQDVGQSDCVVIGRYITIQGMATTVSSVIGYTNQTTPASSDLATLAQYKLSVLGSSTQASSLDWGASISGPSNVNNQAVSNPTQEFAILILRSPLSDTNLTFTSQTIPTNSINTSPSSMVTAADQVSQRMCVNSGNAFNGGLAVVVGANASNENDIQVRSNSMGDSSTC